MSHQPTSGKAAAAAIVTAGLCGCAYIRGGTDQPHRAAAAPKPVPVRTVVIHQVTHATAFHWPVNGIEITIIAIVALGVLCAIRVMRVLRPGRSDR